MYGASIPAWDDAVRLLFVHSYSFIRFYSLLFVFQDCQSKCQIRLPFPLETTFENGGINECVLIRLFVFIRYYSFFKIPAEMSHAGGGPVPAPRQAFPADLTQMIQFKMGFSQKTLESMHFGNPRSGFPKGLFSLCFRTDPRLCHAATWDRTGHLSNHCRIAASNSW